MLADWGNQFNQGMTNDINQYPVVNGMRQMPFMTQMGMIAPTATGYGMVNSPNTLAGLMKYASQFKNAGEFTQSIRIPAMLQSETDDLIAHAKLPNIYDAENLAWSRRKINGMQGMVDKMKATHPNPEKAIQLIEKHYPGGWFEGAEQLFNQAKGILGK